MQTLKGLVIFMGVLIVIMMVAVGYGIVVKFGSLADREEDSAGQAVDAWDGNPHVSVPAGARVVETVAADGRLVVRLALADGSARYLVFDLANGRQVGAIDLAAGAEGQ